jgi:excisionase family DNA binding protein
MPGMTDTQELLTVEQAAERRGVAPTTIYKAVADGRLPAQRLFGRVLIRIADADAFEPLPRGGPRGGGRPRKQQQAEVHGPQTGRE